MKIIIILSPSARKKPPKLGYDKINFGAAIHNHNITGTIVIRDFNDYIFDCRTKFYKENFVKECETFVHLFSLELVLQLNFKTNYVKVTIEMLQRLLCMMIFIIS